jgi:hypothetical protein
MCGKVRRNKRSKKEEKSSPKRRATLEKQKKNDFGKDYSLETATPDLPFPSRKSHSFGCCDRLFHHGKSREEVGKNLQWTFSHVENRDRKNCLEFSTVFSMV